MTLQQHILYLKPKTKILLLQQTTNFRTIVVTFIRRVNTYSFNMNY